MNNTVRAINHQIFSYANFTIKFCESKFRVSFLVGNFCEQWGCRRVSASDINVSLLALDLEYSCAERDTNIILRARTPNSRIRAANWRESLPAHAQLGSSVRRVFANTPSPRQTKGKMFGAGECKYYWNNKARVKNRARP